MQRCVVIGGGISGMAAAILLAQQGMDVTLAEKAPRLGPLLRGFSRNGFHFETGFHFAGGMAEGGVLRRWLKTLELDLPWNAFLPETEIVCTERGSHTLPTGNDALRDWTKRLFPASQKGMDDFLRACAEIQNRSPYLSPHEIIPHDFFSHDACGLNEYLDGLRMEDELKTILQARCMLYGVSPKDARRDDFFLVSGAYLHSSGALPGGGTAIVEACEKRLLSLGARLVCGKAAVALDIDEKQTRGVVLEDGTRLPADVVIFTGRPSQLTNMLPAGALRPAYFRHIAAMEETREPVILYGVADHAVPPLHAWYFVPENGRFAMAEDERPSFCVTTGEETPQGEKACIVMMMSQYEDTKEDHEKQQIQHNQRKKNLEKTLIPYIKKRFPLLESHWRYIEISTGHAMKRWIYGSSGSFYGFAHTKTSIPISPATKVRGLFLAGQNILFPGMLGCVISAAIAAGFTAGEDRILHRFRTCVKEEL